MRTRPVGPPAATGLVTALLAAMIVVIVPAQRAGAQTVATSAARAVSYATRHHLTSGIAVLDTSTGALYVAGRSTRRYASASVVKTLIATRLLLTGKMTGPTAVLARSMITRSDNSAAWALYPKVGRDALLPWIARHYRLNGLGARPTMPGIWGSTQVTARGMVRFYAAVRKDPKVWPWLSRAMHSYRSVSSSGEPNAFGIAAAAPSSAIKNGWDVDRDVNAPTNAIVNTTGLVGHDRYAVAILSEGPGSLYYAAAERIVTHEAELLMPRGRITPIPPPIVRAVSPGSGRTAGGTRITVTGTGYTHATSVRFGSATGRSVHVISSTKLQATAPSHAPGRVDVRVATAYGTSSTGRFSYVAAPTVSALSPDSGPVAGGTAVTVTGANLSHVHVVRFGAVVGTSVHVLSTSRLQVTAPAGAAGSVSLSVGSDYGSSPAGVRIAFTYVAAPTVTAITPDTGGVAGGEQVSITGTGFRHVGSVGFGGVEATSVSVVSPTTLSATVPPGAAGTVDVSVTTDYGTSALVATDHYTYA